MADLPGPPDGQEEVEPPRDAAHERARKVNPVYSEGELVRVAWAANQAEAELIQGMLLEEGVPSSLRRTIGFDVPDFLAAGPRDVMVPAAGAEVARALLDDTGMAPPSGAAEPPLGQALRIVLVVLLVGGVGAGLAWLALQSAG